VLWFSPVRTTPERVRRLACELRAQSFQTDHARAEAVLTRLQTKIKKVWWIAGIATCAFTVGALFKVIIISPIEFSVPDRQVFMAFIALSIGLFGWAVRKEPPSI
jgi:hypothetical protein